MVDTPLLTRLAKHRALGTAPANEHAWLAEHGILRAFAVGEVLTRKGASATSLQIMLTGHVVIRVDRGAGSHKIFEWLAGDVGGLMPYSRGASPPADAVAEAATEVLEIAREQFPELIRECPVVTTTLVHAMVDRARKFTSGDHRDEKLISLGKLAAGLAHELNNPASAAVRSAKALTESLVGAEAAARRLGAARLSDAQLSAVDAVREVCLRSGAPLAYSAVARADREDLFAAWLAAHGASERCAVPLAQTALTLDALDTLAATVGPEALDPALQWIAAGCHVRTLASQIEASASRISGLVDAVKGFTFMDHALSPGPVDIRRGITDTFTMLGAKARAKSVEVSVQLAADLPRAHGVGAELNQVWMNLIDNALDAVAVGGRVEVTASEALGRVVVRIVDNGPGIPAAIQARVFDPFFTTKGVGQGTGLGLDIVRRLVQQHEGEIELESRPGHTEFRVSLPAEGGPISPD
jgi:signal transduction histidine kinase